MTSWESTTCSQNSLLFVMIFFKTFPTKIQYPFLIYNNPLLISFKCCLHHSKECVQFRGHCKTLTTQNTLHWRVCSPMHHCQWDYPLPAIHNCLFCKFTSSELAETVTPLICIQEVPGSNRDQITILTEALGSFPQYLQANGNNV
jgi:hypothetical protein